MFTSLAQCAKVSFLFLEESGQTEWAVGKMRSLGARSSTNGRVDLEKMGRCQFVFLFKFESKSSSDNWMLNDIYEYFYKNYLAEKCFLVWNGVWAH